MCFASANSESARIFNVRLVHAELFCRRKMPLGSDALHQISPWSVEFRQSPFSLCLGACVFVVLAAAPPFSILVSCSHIRLRTVCCVSRKTRTTFITRGTNALTQDQPINGSNATQGEFGITFKIRPFSADLSNCLRMSTIWLSLKYKKLKRRTSSQNVHSSFNSMQPSYITRWTSHTTISFIFWSGKGKRPR